MSTTKRVNELTLVSDIEDGDVLVGERVNGTTVRIPYVAPTGVSDGDKGDITVSSTGTVWTIDTPASTTVATDDKVLIKDTSASNVMKYVTAQSIADLAGITDGDKGDITVSGSGATWTIDNDAVTYAKMQNVSATARIMGRNTVGAGDMEELAASTVKTMLSLDNVENTALSTWTGSTNVTTLGNIDTGTWNGTAVTVTYGGSGRSSATAYALIVGGTTSTGAHQSISSGSTGQILQSAGSAAIPTWSTSTIPTSAGATANKVLLSDGTNYVLSTPTFPNVSATSRKITVSDGTNWVASTETYAVPGSAGNLLRSDGTNWTAAKAILTTDVTGVLPVANGGIGVSKIPSFFATRSAQQSINNATYTKVQFDTETYDTDSYYDNVTNYRFTPLVAGKYLVCASLAYESVVDQTYQNTALYKNGAGIFYTEVRASGTVGSTITTTAIVSLNGSTDYIEIYAYQDSGSAKNIQPYSVFSAIWMGP